MSEDQEMAIEFSPPTRIRCANHGETDEYMRITLYNEPKSDVFYCLRCWSEYLDMTIGRAALSGGVRPMTLYLADLSGMTEEQVKAHIADNYAGEVSGFNYGCPSDDDKQKVAENLRGYDVCVAYEHVGSWGCESASFFILRNKETGAFAFFTGGHCSCYGFEGQYEPEEMPNSFFHSAKFSVYGGGYDEDAEAHKQAVKEWIAANIPARDAEESAQ
jgi:hypothetical protein